MGLMHMNELQRQNQQNIGLPCQHHHKKNDDLFAPIKSKMRVLKKIKKRMGLAPRNSASWPGPNNLPPLQFHDVHGDNIRLSRDRTLAKRYETFCKGVAFSARPIKINERICIRFSEVSRNWSGVLRFGFTYNDPATLRNNLPKYACPDLTNKPGFWAKALPEQFCERDYILFYYVTAAGDVYFGVNGEEMGVFITGVETRHPLWTLVDIYGNCSAIEFVDSRACVHQTQSQRRSVPREQEIDRIVPSMQSLAVNEHPAVPVIQQQHQQQPQTARSAAVYGNTYTPVTFHRVKGRNVVLSADKLVATRADSEYCQGYVFTARPICIGEKIIVQILRTDSMYMGALALGLTSCNAATLQPQDLPDDSDLLLDRPEYWVVSKDVASNLNRGDEIIFCVTPSGEVQISKNNGPPSVVMHVDQSLQLWAFLDVYGSTQSVRVFSHMVAPSQYNNPLNVPNTNSIVPQRQLSQQSVRMPMPSTESLSSASSQSLYRGENQQTRMPTPLSHIKPTVQAITTAATTATLPSSSSTGCVINNDMIQLQPGGTVLVVNLPPATNNDINNKQVVPRITQLPLNAAQTSNASPMPAKPTQSQQYGPMSQWHQDAAAANLTTGAECTICYEASIDSVLYMCGHMCMCYDCAIKQWRGIGGGHCPLCRAVIRDVIRTYKS